MVSASFAGDRNSLPSTFQRTLKGAAIHKMKQIHYAKRYGNPKQTVLGYNGFLNRSVLVKSLPETDG